MLVDDDSVAAQSIIEGFSTSKYTIDWFRSGKEAAVALHARRSWSLVILELSLPDLGGMSVLRVMRNRNNSTPVIVVSRQSSAQSRVDALNAGADDFLGKPFDLAELHARVYALLRRSE